MIREIIILDKSEFCSKNNILRQCSSKVVDFGEELQVEIDSLIDTYKYLNTGRGLSAPQIGIFKRFALIVPDISNRSDFFIIVNPVITKLYGPELSYNEGCISLAKLHGEVLRKSKLTLNYHDRYGNFKELYAENILTRVILHETDHLDGILYTDRMIDPLNLI